MTYSRGSGSVSPARSPPARGACRGRGGGRGRRERLARSEGPEAVLRRANAARARARSRGCVARRRVAPIRRGAEGRLARRRGRDSGGCSRRWGLFLRGLFRRRDADASNPAGDERHHDRTHAVLRAEQVGSDQTRGLRGGDEVSGEQGEVREVRGGPRGVRRQERSFTERGEWRQYKSSLTREVVEAKKRAAREKGR